MTTLVGRNVDIMTGALEGLWMLKVDGAMVGNRDGCIIGFVVMTSDDGEKVLGEGRGEG